MVKGKKVRKVISCPPREGVTHYQIMLNDQIQEPIPATPDGDTQIDLTGLSNGTHRYCLRAGNKWSANHIEWSDWSTEKEFTIFRPEVPHDFQTDVVEE